MASKVTFGALKKLSPAQRRQSLQGDAGPLILSLLTPSQIAAAFPDYYKRPLPDVSGFRAAVSKSTQQQQERFDQAVADRLGIDPKTGRRKGGWLEKMREDFGPGGAKSKTLSPIERAVKEQTGMDISAGAAQAELRGDQKKLFEDIKAGRLSLDDPRAAVFKKMMPKDFANAGLKIEDVNGKQYVKMAPVEVTEEQIQKYAPGRYRPKYNLKDSDLSDEVVNTIAGEVSAGNKKGVDAVINVLMNRVGSKKYAGSDSLQGLVSAPEQFKGYNKGRPTKEQAEFIRERIRAIASGSEPDITGGANEFRAKSYVFGEGQGKDFYRDAEKQGFIDIGGNIYANRSKTGSPYASYVHSGEQPPPTTLTPEQRKAAEEKAKENVLQERGQAFAAGTIETPSGLSGKALEEFNKMPPGEKQRFSDAFYKLGGGEQANKKLNEQIEKTGSATVEKPGTTTKWGQVTPLEGHSTGYCARGVVHLSKQLFRGNPYFDNTPTVGSGVASAADVAHGKNRFFENSGMWKRGTTLGRSDLTDEYLDSLPDGTIIAVGGGKTGSQGQDLGHIQMKVNGKWVSDFPQQSGVLKHRNGNDYDGQFTVLELTQQGKQELQKNGYFTGVTQTAASETKPVQPPAPPSPLPKSQTEERPAEEHADPFPEQKEVQKEKGPDTTATVEAKKPEPVKYKFNEAEFIKEVRAKETGAVFVSDEYIMGETIKGFKDTPGVKYDRKTGTLTIEDPNSPAIQTIINDMKSHGFNQNKFLHKQEGKQAAIEPSTQTAMVSKPEKGGMFDFVQSAQAQELDLTDPKVRAAIKAQHERKSQSNLVDYQGSKTASALGMSNEQYTAFRKAVSGIESGGGDWRNMKYNIRGGSSNRFAGAYQMGGAEITEAAKRLGEVPPVMKRGRKTVANEAFLNDPKMQERYFDEYMLSHHESLLRRNKKYANMSAEQQMHALAVSHNAGSGGASRWINTGKTSKDAFGTDPTKYSKALDQQFAELKQQQETQVAAVQQQEAPSLVERAKSAMGYGTAGAAETKPSTPAPEKPKPQPEFPKTPKTDVTPTPPQRPMEISPVTQAREQGKPDERSTQDFLKSQGVGQAEKVPAKAEGGDVNVKGEVAAYPIGGLRGDNTVAVDTTTQRPLFTFNPQREAVVPNGDSRAEVVPTNKIDSGNVSKSGQPNVMGELDKLRQEMSNVFADIGQAKRNPETPKSQETPTNDPMFLENIMQQGKTPYQNPSFLRAMSRAKGFAETGDATDGNHYSHGNKS